MRKPKVLKLNTLILLALFMFTNVPQYPNFNFGEAIDLNGGSQKDFGSPISAARDFFYFSVNGTQLYEDGIYYCFQADILDLYLNTSSDIPHSPLGNVVLDISSFGSSIVFNYIGGGSGYKEWGYSLPDRKSVV